MFIWPEQSGTLHNLSSVYFITEHSYLTPIMPRSIISMAKKKFMVIFHRIDRVSVKQISLTSLATFWWYRHIRDRAKQISRPQNYTAIAENASMLFPCLQLINTCIWCYMKTYGIRTHTWQNFLSTDVRLALLLIKSMSNEDLRVTWMTIFKWFYYLN